MKYLSIVVLVAGVMGFAPMRAYGDDPGTQLAVGVLQVIVDALNNNPPPNPNPNPNVTPGGPPKFGVVAQPGRYGMKIRRVVNNSIAAELNMKAGDEIINMNGIAIRSINDFDFAMIDAFNRARNDSNGIADVRFTAIDVATGTEFEDFFFVDSRGRTIKDNNFVVKQAGVGSGGGDSYPKNSGRGRSAPTGTGGGGSGPRRGRL